MILFTGVWGTLNDAGTACLYSSNVILNANKIFSDKNANTFMAQGFTFLTNEIQKLIFNKLKILWFIERQSCK